MSSPDLCLGYLSATRAARLLADGELRAVEYVSALLDRIALLQGSLHPFISIFRDKALQAAECADIKQRANKTLPPLHGLPFAVKDNIDVAGSPTTLHSRFPAEQAKRSAAVVSRLEQAGAILIGKLGLEEFALGSPLDTLPWPSPKNPWDTTRTAGGSSSGSAVALAAGLVPLALGTDTGGSVRAPAAYCGLVALKPTYGRIAKDGVFPLVPAFDTVGPMARSADDCALMFAAAAGSTKRYSAGTSKIGWVAPEHELASVDGDVRTAMLAARSIFEKLGEFVGDAQVPDLRTYLEFGQIVFEFETYALNAERLRLRPELFGETCRTRLASGAGIPAEKYEAALRYCARLRREVDAIFNHVDVLAMPVTLGAAARLDDPVDFARSSNVVYRMLPNITGHPAIAFCTGFNDAGLPLSMQLLARRGEDERLLGLVSAFQKQTSWHETQPSSLGCLHGR